MNSQIEIAVNRQLSSPHWTHQEFAKPSSPGLASEPVQRDNHVMEQKAKESTPASKLLTIGIVLVSLFMFYKCSTSSDNKATPTPTVETASQPVVNGNTITQKMSFDNCAKAIEATVNKLGVPYNTLVNTKIMKMVKIKSSDADILITCSEPDQQMTTVVTQH